MGTLHRAAASGALELVETSGRTHRIHWSQGFVSAVELDGVDASLAERLRASGLSEEILRRSLLRALASRRLHGDVLINDFSIDEQTVVGALHAQIASRLAHIERLDDAQIMFRVQLRAPRSSMQERPVRPETFLHGRSRARDRRWREARVDARTSPSGRRIVAAAAVAESSAYGVLGLSESASWTDVKRAYRAAVRACHPDLHPVVTDEEKSRLTRRFREITEAYRTLETELASDA